MLLSNSKESPAFRRGESQTGCLPIVVVVEKEIG